MGVNITHVDNVPINSAVPKPLPVTISGAAAGGAVPIVGGPTSSTQLLSGMALVTTTATSNFCSGPGGGNKTYCTDIILSNTGAADTVVTLNDGILNVAVIPLAMKQTVVINYKTPLRSNGADFKATCSVASTVNIGYSGFYSAT